jgi:phosphoribosyl 1,2-cyclic phosphodiesterase
VSVLLNVTFFGVRGSTPCCSPAHLRYGGNTSCVVLESPGSEPIVCDLGTGLRGWGATQPLDGSFVAHALVSHLHFDHVQGLPFLAPADRPGARLDVYAPPQDEMSVAEAFRSFIQPPYFPVTCAELRGNYAFHEVADTEVVVGDAKVMVRSVPHVGLTNGYRIELGGASVAYVSDHQMPVDGTHDFPPSVLELAADVDLLIHDAQYTPEEFAERAHWGHCTTDFAIDVALAAGAKRLALFHHDPLHTDEVVDQLAAAGQARAGDRLEVIAAAEGMTITFADDPDDPLATAN